MFECVPVKLICMSAIEFDRNAIPPLDILTCNVKKTYVHVHI